MSTQIKPALIFDMDGTLWDSAENVAKSWSSVSETWEGVKKTITTQNVQSVMGLTMNKLADMLFPELDEPERSKLLQACCRVENAYLKEHGGILYDGVEETLAALQKDYHLFIVSNCQSGYIEAFLDYYRLWQYIEDIECFGNNGKTKGENIRLICERNGIAVKSAVYVGDIQGDYDSSCQAGVGFIHAGYGFGEIDADVLHLHSFQELLTREQEVKKVFSALQNCP